mgnify:CR=1 FL=1
MSAPAGVRPPKPRPAFGAWSMVAVAVVITIVAGSAIDFDLLPLFRDTGRGWFIVSQFFAPDWSYLGRTVAPLVDTIAIAVVATGFGCVLVLVACVSGVMTAATLARIIETAHL